MRQPASVVIPDPGIAHGDFQVLQTVTGEFIVRDHRRQLGLQTVVRAKTLEEATRKAAQLHALETKERAA